MFTTKSPVLEEQVKKLECSTNKEEQQRILQKINELLINNFSIKINDNITIKPLLVEAYYYHNKKFEDENSYREPEQCDNFGKLFIHPKKYSLGIDICLSLNSSYFLSFLIKNAIIEDAADKQFYSQQAIYYYLLNNTDINALVNKEVLIENHSQYEIIHTVRKGVKEPFKNCPLASLPIDIDIIKEYKLTPGKSRTTLIEEYIKNKLSLKNLDDNEKQKLKELAKGFITWKKLEEN